jgi:tellurite resistance protein
MVGLLIPVLVVALGTAAMIAIIVGWDPKLGGLAGRFKLPSLPRRSSGFDDIIQLASRPDLSVLNCRVRLTTEPDDNRYVDSFSVEICGTIHAPDDTHHACVRIEMMDMAEGGLPVRSRVKQWQKQGSAAFFYTAQLGKLPNAENTLSDWMAVAKIHADWLLFPRKGERSLLLGLSVLSGESGAELAGAECTFSYENEAFGYIELHENLQRAKMLAVPLAFAVSAADGKLYESEIEVIREWVRANMAVSDACEQVAKELDRGLDKTVDFYRQGHHLDNEKICRDIVGLTPVAERYDILELCLYVTQANGQASPEEINLLRQLAGWLEVDTERFQAMMEKILPVSMHEVEDVQAILGVSADMDEQKTREQLNREYRKWIARVTSSDPEIQSQADQMIKLIAEARSAYMT